MTDSILSLYAAANRFAADRLSLSVQRMHNTQKLILRRTSRTCVPYLSPSNGKVLYRAHTATN